MLQPQSDAVNLRRPLILAATSDYRRPPSLIRNQSAKPESVVRTDAGARIKPKNQMPLNPGNPTQANAKTRPQMSPMTPPMAAWSSPARKVPKGHIAHPVPHPSANLRIELVSPVAAMATCLGILMFRRSVIHAQ